MTLTGCRAEIDLTAAAENYRALRARLPAGCRLCCVVKANAYGHGASVLAPLYEWLGADALAVASLDEGVAIRSLGVRLPVLILGYTPPDAAGELIANRLIQSVPALSYARELDRQAEAAGGCVQVHLQLDTGMSRLGFRITGRGGKHGVRDALRAAGLPYLTASGAYTHFASADEGEAGDAGTLRQFACFRTFCRAAEREGRPLLCHAANSAALLDHPSYAMDGVRAGICLYGYLPSDRIRSPAPLLPVLSLHAPVVHLTTLRAGESVGYGESWRAEKKSRVATLPLGYADGIRRACAGGDVCLCGTRCRIVGRICMDQMMVDVSGVTGVRVGTDATVIGAAPAPGADEIAARCRTIPYEILTAIGPRIGRVGVNAPPCCPH